MFTAFAWWRKKQPVRFQPAVFLLNILEENVPCYFMLKACCPIMVPSAKI